MKHKTLRIVVTLALGAISFWVHWITWTRWMSLSWTCGTAVLILALIGLVWRGYDADAEAVTEGRMTDPALPYSLGDWFRVGLGLALAWAGYQALLAQALLLALTAAIALAYAWRPYVDRRAVDFGRAEGLAALALILLGSAWLRLYEIGDVPYGFTIPDEPLLMIKAIDYANGLRETFARGPGSILDGVVPFYIQAAFIKLFGPTIFVYRLQAALLGLLLVLMMYKFVALSGQRFLAVAAAGFMGLSLWPVVFSRAQYLMNETYLVILGSLLFLVWAWRKGSGLAFALSGLCLGLSLSVYKSAQLGFAYLPLLGGLLFVSSPIRRERFSWGWAPFLTGFILGSAFLLQWFIQHPAQAQFDYFRQMQATHTAGVGVTSTTLLGQLDQVLGRTLPRFTALMQMYTSRGPDIPFYFPKDHPVLGPVSVFFALTGLGIAFIRFRFWLASFSVLLFFIGLLPALAGNPAYTLNERRSMISMLAIAVIAGLGLWGMAVAFASGLPALWRKRALLALLALSFISGIRRTMDF
jgi:4-amino-4-deoxy-L-arabinose transferase-like glycosyltransferase